MLGLPLAIVFVIILIIGLLVLSAVRSHIAYSRETRWEREVRPDYPNCLQRRKVGR